MIPQETIAQIFDTSIIEEVVGDFITLKKRGVNYLGNCPFHNEKTPSFTVSPAKGIYKCFGCGKGGNSVNFIMDHEQLTYPEALKYLANKYSIEIEEQELTPEQQERQTSRESLQIVHSFARDYFTEQLLKTDEGKSVGLSYFKKRGFTEETIERFQLGYNPSKWDNFTTAALKAGYKLEYLQQAGLTKVNGDKQFDFFKGRVMFPIHNLTGKVIGFGGRTLSADKKTAKYFNSPENEIYNKSKVLYGLYFAKKSIVQNDTCFIVEGYTDVISLAQTGIENVVSSSGTSLTVDQIKLIRRYTPNITILFDGDVAGIKASFRGIDMILREDMNVRVVLFPEGEDPDSYAKKLGKEDLSKYIEDNTKDFIKFKTDVLLKETGGDPIKKANLITDIIRTISLISNEVKRSIYIAECSQLFEISEKALYNELNKVLRKNFTKENKISPEVAEAIPTFEYDTKEDKKVEIRSSAHQEQYIIQLLLKYGAEFIEIEIENEDGKPEMVSVQVAEYILHELATDDISFSNANFQGIYNQFVHWIENEEEVNTKSFFQHDNMNVVETCIALTESPYSLSENWKEYHQIYVVTEDMKLKPAIEYGVLALKAKKVDLHIVSLQDQLKIVKEEDKLNDILVEQIQYLTLKKAIAEKLNRVIVK